jgi:hypothetical protein
MHLFNNYRHVHDGCDEAVDLHRTKPEEYVCCTCKNRTVIPVRAYYRFSFCGIKSIYHVPSYNQYAGIGITFAAA